MIICTIDPGIRNFAIYVEKFNHNKLAMLAGSERKRIKGERKGKKGRYINQWFLDQVYLEGRSILAEVVDLIPGLPVKKNMNLARARLMILLEDLRPVLDTCDAFFCERQLRLNPSAQSIEHVCYSFLAATYLDNRIVSSVGANRKYYFLNCKSGMSKTQRKKWSPIIALEIMMKRGDDTMIDKLSCIKKKDDVADTVIIAQSIKYSVFFENTI